MQKKAQVSVFVIVGVVVVILLGVFLFFSSKNQFGDTESYAKQQYFNAQQTQLDTFIYECVRQTTIDAETKLGISESVSGPLITLYLDNNLPACFDDFKELKKQGYRIETGELKAKVRVLPEQIIAEITYPITAVKGDSEMRFSYRYYEFPRVVMETLNQNGPTTVVSADGSLILEIPQGTVATLNGNSVDKVGLMVLDRNFEGLSNSVLAGMLAFEGLPQGTKFSKPVKITRYYKDFDVPIVIKEDELSLGYFNRETGTWIGVPTHIDKTEKKLTAEVMHFTPYGTVTGCTQGYTGKLELKDLITSPCFPCEGWNEDKPRNSDACDSTDQNKKGPNKNCEVGTTRTGTEGDPVTSPDEKYNYELYALKEIYGEVVVVENPDPIDFFKAYSS
jgi:hypothetical protein